MRGNAYSPTLSVNQQRGVAILLAMLIVTLVASVAASATWQQWRSTEVETADRARLQSQWLLTGAGDWARLMLRESTRSSGAVHLSQPWAVPLQEARLADFLAAERNVRIDTSDIPDDVFISGRIEDMQGRFNLNNLVRHNALSSADVQALQRLFTQLQLPASQARDLAHAWLRSKRASHNPAEDMDAPPLPTRIQQLGWIGIPPSTIERLRPWIALLPEEGTLLNANTAKPEVLQAVLNISAGEAQRLVTLRASQPFSASNPVEAVLPAHAATRSKQLVGVSSNYFLTQAMLRLGSVVMQQQSLLQVKSMAVNVLWRENGSFAELQATTQEKKP